MTDPLFTAGVSSRLSLEDAIHCGDSITINRFFKTMERNSKITGIFVAAILVCIAIGMFVTAFHTGQTAARDTPAYPSEAGTDPVTRLVDKTGFVSPYYLDNILYDLVRIADEYHIQTAIYSSDEPAHDVYDEFFTDENGVVLYIEEHEDYGSVIYYYGEELSDIFTDSNIAILDESQSFLDAFTHNRVPAVVTDFRNGMDKVFRGAEAAASRMPFEIINGILWLIMAAIFYFLTRFVYFVIVGLPPTKIQRALYQKYILSSADLEKMKL